MKKIIVLLLVFGLAFTGCSSGGDSPTADDGSLSGTITIQMYGYQVTTAYTGAVLEAVYSGTETVSYQWKWKQNAAAAYADVGTDAASFKALQEGSYTVTVSAPGKTSKTSAPVAVTLNPEKDNLTGPVEFYIAGETDPVAAAETGQEITAVYAGSELATFSYQWFKDGIAVQDYESVNNDKYTPTEAGSYTITLTASGYNPFTSDPPIVITGQTLLTITFELNGASGENPTRIIAPGEEIGSLLPPPPVYNGFTFAGWYTAGDEEVTETTTFDESITVYAHWIFQGGTPYVNDEANTLVHPNPLMEKGLNFAGTISEDDGTITYTAGAFQYKWPTGDWDITDYAYCIVRFELLSSTGNVSGVSLRPYNSGNTQYGGLSNWQPWLSNISSAGINLPLFGAGATGGFSVVFGGQAGTAIKVRITSVTFYKLPWRTVTFNLNGGSGTIPENGITVYNGYTIGDQRPGQFPAVPTMPDYTFMGWKNPAGTIVTATTPITADWELAAQWTLTSELTTPEDTAPANDTLFAATGGSSAAKFTYDGKQWWVMAETPPGTPAAVAPFDGAAAGTYTAALAAASAYARVSYNLPSLSSIWQSFSKVTITYDLIMVGGTDRSIVVRNGTGGGGDPTIVTQAFEAGSNKTITFNTSAITSGNLAFVANNNGGTDALFLLRITKVELKLD